MVQLDIIMTDNYYKGRICSVVSCSFGKKLDLVIILSSEKNGIPNFNQHNLVSIVFIYFRFYLLRDRQRSFRFQFQITINIVT